MLRNGGVVKYIVYKSAMFDVGSQELLEKHLFEKIFVWVIFGGYYDV